MRRNYGPKDRGGSRTEREEEEGITRRISEELLKNKYCKTSCEKE